MTIKEFVETISKGEKSLYNKVTGMLLIPDLVDGADRENEEYGMRAGNGDWLYGVMTCKLDPEKRKEYEAEYGSLVEYALGCVPAPGTCAPDRMGFVPINEMDDIETFARWLMQFPQNWEAA